MAHKLALPAFKRARTNVFELATSSCLVQICNENFAIFQILTKQQAYENLHVSKICLHHIADMLLIPFFPATFFHISLDDKKRL